MLSGDASKTAYLYNGRQYGVATDAESQLEKTAERTETTNPCTCKGNSQCFVAGTIIKTKLEVGDEILTSEGQKISIVKIEIEVFSRTCIRL